MKARPVLPSGPGKRLLSVWTNTAPQVFLILIPTMCHVMPVLLPLGMQLTYLNRLNPIVLNVISSSVIGVTLYTSAYQLPCIISAPRWITTSPRRWRVYPDAGLIHGYATDNSA